MAASMSTEEARTHLKHIKTLARSMYVQTGKIIDLEEFVSAGCLALVECWSRFDPSRSVAFSTYVFPRIRGRMRDVVQAYRRRGKFVELEVEPSVSYTGWRDARDALETLRGMKFNAREGVLIQKRIMNGWTYKQVGLLLNLNKTTVMWLERRLLSRLKQVLESDGLVGVYAVRDVSKARIKRKIQEIRKGV